jgi:hypothetical protein
MVASSRDHQTGTMPDSTAGVQLLTPVSGDDDVPGVAVFGGLSR